ncbi:hypothetical protein OFB92_36755, partial [Escherichia coli]|nr:hypothetical protein [Escherichia coli]
MEALNITAKVGEANFRGQAVVSDTVAPVNVLFFGFQYQMSLIFKRQPAHNQPRPRKILHGNVPEYG